MEYFSYFKDNILDTKNVKNPFRKNGVLGYLVKNLLLNLRAHFFYKSILQRIIFSTRCITVDGFGRSGTCSKMRNSNHNYQTSPCIRPFQAPKTHFQAKAMSHSESAPKTESNDVCFITNIFPSKCYLRGTTGDFFEKKS